MGASVQPLLSLTTRRLWSDEAVPFSLRSRSSAILEIEAPLEPEERKAALEVVYKGRSRDGAVPFDAFLKWFRTDDDPEGADEPAPQEVPAAVRKGLKEDGEAVGSEKDWEDRKGPSMLGSMEFEGIPAAN